MRAPDLEKDGWCLHDGEQRSREAPETFLIPNLALQEILQPGDFAKLIFEIAVEGEEYPAVERMFYYASRWAVRVGGGVVMLRIIEIEDQNQQWLGVVDIMRAEAEEAANEALDRASGRANGIAAITPERAIREGEPTEQILDVIDKDVDIAMLVLAANPGPEGPGPLITIMAQAAGSFPIPVVIVPGDLSDADIDGLS